MAGKSKRMSQIKQLILLHIQGVSKKAIAKQLNISKNTVKAYLEKMASLHQSPQHLLKLDDPVLERVFHAGSPAYSDKRFEDMQQQLDYYIKELNRKGVTMKLLWEEYRNQKQDGYGYTQFCFHINQYLLRKHPVMVLQHHPGDKLYIDFAGQTTSYNDISTGEIVRCQVFVACLPYSDYGFAIAVPSQKLTDFIYALEQCLIFLGGTPKILVTDNLKAAITKADRYEPSVNQTLEDFANHYGMAVMPARVRKPRDKALVENHVRIFYTQVFARMRNEQYFDLQGLNKAIFQRVVSHNQTRMQQKPYSRQECFLSEEKGLLQPLPVEIFEIKTYRRYKLSDNNFIYLKSERKYYSAPFAYIGKRVDVIYTRSMVKIYYNGQLIAQHQRCYNNRILHVYDMDHLCSTHQHQMGKNPQYYIRRAGEISGVFGQFMELKFETDQPPETLYRSCDGLISLVRKTDPDIISRACEIAIANRNFSKKHLENILLHKTYLMQDLPPPPPLPVHPNIRGKDYYTTQQIQIEMFT